MKLELSRPIFEKSSNIEFYADSSSQSRVVPCGETDERAYMTLIFAFRIVPNASKNVCSETLLETVAQCCTFKYQSSLSHLFIGLCVDSFVIHCLRSMKLT